MMNQDALNSLTVDKNPHRWVKQDGVDRSLKYKISLIKKKNNSIEMIKESIEIANLKEDLEIISNNLECLYDDKADGIVAISKDNEKIIMWWKK